MGCSAEDLLKRHERLLSERAVWEAHWREVAERVLPRSDFFAGRRTPGEKHTELLFDATACLSLERFTAAMESMLIPRPQRWHGLRVRDEALQENVEVKKWLDEVADILFAERYAPNANFACQANDVFMSLGAFGTGALFIESSTEGLRYRSIHLGEICIAENHQGVVDTVFRKFQLTARQAVQRFGADALPDKIATDAQERPDTQHEFLHAVFPNPERVPGALNHRGMAFASHYIAVQGRKIVSEGGYRTFPYAVGRYTTGPKEVYGRSPAMTVLPEIKMVNEMSKTVLRAGQKALDPPLLLQEDGALSGFDLRPGALNFGGVNDQGNAVVLPLDLGSRVDIGDEMIERRQKAINEAFLVTLTQVLVATPRMTAAEALLRAQEKAALLAPTMGRQQSEFLGPMVERELDLLSQIGELPPMPQALLDAGGIVDVEYTSPLNRAQRAEEGLAILRTIESVTPLAQVDPGVMLLFNAEAVARELCEINGVPAKLLRTSEEVAELRKQGVVQADGLVSAGYVGAQAVANLTEMQTIAAGVPATSGVKISAGGQP
jgi:hypothetical protein